jgi:hypothetical protein
MDELVEVADGPTGCGDVVRVGDDLLGRLV